MKPFLTRRVMSPAANLLRQFVGLPISNPFSLGQMQQQLTEAQKAQHAQQEDPLTEQPKTLLQRFTAYFVAFVMLAQIVVPGMASAAQIITDSQLQGDVSSSAQFERAKGDKHLYQRANYVEVGKKSASQDIASFQQKLLKHNKRALPAPSMIPIMTGDITIIIPHFGVPKLIGDEFVQSRLIRSQVFNLLNRNLVSEAYATEAIQIDALYAAALTFSKSKSAIQWGIKFGDKLTQSQVNSYNKNFIWPERRKINGQWVLVPIVHLPKEYVEKVMLASHEVRIGGSKATFNSVTVNAGKLYSARNTFIKTLGDFIVKPNATVVASGDLNLLVGGTLQNLSGTISAKQNVNIVANQYLQKTMVHRYATPYEQGTRLGPIASVNANGTINIRSMNDIIIQGGKVDSKTGSIMLTADGNIAIVSQQTSYVRNDKVGGYDTEQSVVSHTASVLSAKDSIYLMASGVIQINASTLTADQGVIEILADQGIYITNEFDEFQQSRHGKVGNVTLQEQEFQTIAIRSALEAGKGVLIASDFGDITLRATEIKSGDGTQINANDGAINLLLAKEQDHYFMNRVKKGMWKIKTQTINDKVDTAVYNNIVGGVKIHATHGLSIELGQSEDMTLDDILDEFSKTEGLSWMADLYNDPEYHDNIETSYQALLNIHEHKKTSNLSPAAMAVIAIAMAVVTGGAGLAALAANAGAAIAGSAAAGAVGMAGMAATFEAAIAAGMLALSTQTAISLANGNGLIDTAKQMHSTDTVRTVAQSMVTAGALQYVGGMDFFDATQEVVKGGEVVKEVNTGIQLANQATQMVTRATVNAGINTIFSHGHLSDFGDQFVQSLQQDAINQLGRTMAGKIGAAVDEKSIGQAVRYMSHAALGCGIGLATANVHGSDKKNKISCLSGAGGAVAGEVIGDIYKSQTEYNNKVTEVKDELAKYGLTTKDIGSLTEEQQKQIAGNYTLVNGLKTIKTLKDRGVNIAKLGTALGAFIAKADVNIAADAGVNAVENNVFWFALQGAYFLYKAYEFYESIKDVIKLVDDLKNASDEQRIALLQQFAIDQLQSAVIGKSTGKVMDEIITRMKKTGVGKHVIDELAHVQDLLEQGNLKMYKPGAGKKGKPVTHEKPTKVDDKAQSHVNPNLKTVSLKTRDEYRAACKDPKPNTVYEFDGMSYTTDELGRGVSSSGRLRLQDGGNRFYDDRMIGHKGETNDIGFHAGADQFGFQGGDLNISPGNRKLNGKEYASLERKLRDHLKVGDTVVAEFKSVFKPGNTSVRPDGYIVKYKVNEGKVFTEKFANKEGG
ncbi:DUF637 domain-containing protein [uncultured Shewanella sp.]|uniref:DUF637 domain-containing protein n=1 Tax=uncultured Shewanella sp. TaxID=173975 RepID=UPI00261E6E75|nr:DUF637 domain-containing protein [uncultured Shewanella sp.]